MKLNPQQAPLYGQGVITVQLADEELAADEEGVDYFLLFAGSTQRHLTSTLRSSHDTLQAVCPAHDCCEGVLVTLCSVARVVTEVPEELSVGCVAPLAEQRFSFVQDLAFDMAQFLVSTAGRTNALDGALMLDECQIPLQECERLDESLALALHHLALPPGWSLLGNKLTNSTELNPQETLLHFSARRGLFRVTNFLLQQPGAKQALRLSNRQGHTPSAVAASRGHRRLHELLTEAHTDAEKGTAAGHRVSTDARVICHLPSLNTHTLTVRIRPGREPPTLQKSVEQLLHLICHLHAKGVSALDLEFDCLHTAAECCDGVKTEETCVGKVQQANASKCSDTTAEGSWVENCPVESSCTDLVHGETEKAEKDWSSSVSTPTSEVRPEEHGLASLEERVCFSANTERNYCQTEEEGRDQPVVSTQSLSEGARSEEERANLTAGILPPAGCGEQAEETDIAEAVIQEGQEATEGEDRSEQEEEHSTARRKQEEETNCESTDRITPSGDTEALVMGQSPSSEGSEVSDNSDSEMKDCCHDEETLGREEMKLNEALCDVLSSEKTANDGLTEPVSTSGDLPNPSLIDSGDVIGEPESAFSRLLIEGLHKGEPPPDINSLEQNQETAGRDYATEQQRGSAPETDSGNCTGTANAKELDGQDVDEPTGCRVENSPLPMDEPGETADGQTAGNSIEDTQTEQVECPAQGVSSDDDGSFQSVGSSTTELFHPTQDNVTMEEPVLAQSKTAELSSVGSIMEESNDLTPGERVAPGSPTMEAGQHSEPGAVSAATVTDCNWTGADSETQTPSGTQTMGALNPEGTGEDLDAELSKDYLSPHPVLSECEDSGEAKRSDLNAEVEHSASEVTRGGSFEPRRSVAEETEVNVPVGGDHPSTEAGVTSVVASGEESGHVQCVLQDHLEMKADERSPDEGSRHSEHQINVSTSQSIALLSEPQSPNNETSNEPLVENDVTENPKTPDAVDGASDSHNSATRGGPTLIDLSASSEVDVIKTEDAVIAAGNEENDTAEETDFSTIHRDREASFPQPCSSQHSGSSHSSAFSSLPSRTGSTTSCPSTTHRDSGSDIESFLNAEPGCDSVFKKSDEPLTGGDTASEVSVSCSSTDDTASLGPPSSSPEGSQGPACSWSPEEGIQTGANTCAEPDGGGGGGAGEAEEEAKDRVTEVPRRSCLLRNSIRSLSPLRRHSWGPGKNNGADTEMNQRSSIRSPGEGKPTFHRRSISWCPPNAPHSLRVEVVSSLSYSLEGLSGVQEELRSPTAQGPRVLEPLRRPRHDSDDRGSLVSLTEEQEDLGEHGRLQEAKSRRYRPLRNSCSPMTLPLTKSVSMLAISQRDIDGMRSFSSTSGSLAYSISEEEPGPLRSDTEGKTATKVSRTFSYLKNKMYKKTREKEREKREKEKEGKEKDKKTVNGHLFTAVSSGHAAQCSQCSRALTSKEAFHCTHCNASVHKGCRDSLPVCAKVKMKLPKQQFAVPDSSSFPTVTMRNKSGGTRERPWSAILSPEDHSSLIIPSSRRHNSIMNFHGNNLSKSLSISNIAGPVFDEMPIKGLRYLSQSTDSLNRTNQVTESMESLTDEGTEMMDGQLMGEFEAEAKELEADSWSLGVEQQYLQQLDKELVKRQDVIYELMQTEMHHIRTLRIMSEVYSKGLQKEAQLELQTVERLLPALDELVELHTQHLLRLLERKRECQLEAGSLEGGFIINRIGDILVSQFSGSSGESMRRIYGRFCSRHNEAVNLYKDLLTKDKRFKAFIKKKMSSSIVRRLGIPECILLVTQRITKYPVLIQRMLQHTKESEDDFEDLTEAVRLVKEVIAAVDSKVNEHEKRRRLKDFHGRMDGKSIMMRKSGQIFAREDLLRRRLIHDGALQLKNSQGRLKDVHALLLSDVFIFLQEKDQKYVFAMLDQRSTVISLQKLIIREVANEERGLFLITAGIEKPEMMEVLASSKDERNTWIQLIQEAMQSMEKDEDEGIPSETEDDKRQLETKAKEMRDLLRQKDTEIMSLLEEKVRLFRGMWEGSSPAAEACQQAEPFFRSACSLEPPRGASIMKDALQEVETLQALVNGSLGGAMASVQEGVGVGPVCLPRRAETFGGFDSHQMHSSKSGDRDEGEDTVGDLRRTESDSVLKKGGNANLLLLLKRNSEQVLHSVSNLHLLLSTLQAVVVQQDSFIEDQRQALSERSSSCTSLSRPPSRPSSLVEQEKQRSLEKQRQELASLQRQQAAHAEEKRRREREWEFRGEQLSEREVLVHIQEEEVLKQHKKLEQEKQELHRKKEEYQKDLERLRDAQRKLERDRESVQRHLDNMGELRLAERTPSTTSDDSQFPGSSQSLEADPLELSSSCSLPSPQPQQSKPKGKSLNPFTLSSSNANVKSGEANHQISKSLLQLAKSKSKEGKEKKKKKKGKGGSGQTGDPQHHPEPPLDGEIFFC
ncbi:A-kinase anchor protein 13 isoform X1 [Scophthalmus maximus]|uniref:A-kinase anchor protein 13 isoform X1 n=1 Tax=Scophthalmus maximus TaxID=52904 RepID=UPI001FA8411D|nr:A-kinase anchor protein 13 isoform X1 [Scophthalmus maximus]XP_035485139.2 A-kinase anchor protein 13 isoform X1 [Scophthalmus maximus]